MKGRPDARVLGVVAWWRSHERAWCPAANLTKRAAGMTWQPLDRDIAAAGHVTYLAHELWRFDGRWLSELPPPSPAGRGAALAWAAYEARGPARRKPLLPEEREAARAYWRERVELLGRLAVLAAQARPGRHRDKLLSLCRRVRARAARFMEALR